MMAGGVRAGRVSEGYERAQPGRACHQLMSPANIVAATKASVAKATAKAATGAGCGDDPAARSSCEICCEKGTRARAVVAATGSCGRPALTTIPDGLPETGMSDREGAATGNVDGSVAAQRSWKIAVKGGCENNCCSLWTQLDLCSA